MSFGFSVGNVSAVIQLANKIREDFAGAPSEFKGAMDEVRSLSILLQDARVAASERDLNPKEETDLQTICDGCQNILSELERILGQYSELESQQIGTDRRVKRAWKRLSLESEDIHNLRSRVNDHISLLTAFNSQYARDDATKLMGYQERQAILEWLTPVDSASQQNESENSAEDTKQSNDTKESMVGSGVKTVRDVNAPIYDILLANLVPPVFDVARASNGNQKESYIDIKLVQRMRLRSDPQNSRVKEDTIRLSWREATHRASKMNSTRFRIVDSDQIPTDIIIGTDWREPDCVENGGQVHLNESLKGGQFEEEDMLDFDTRSVTSIRTTWTSSTIAIDQLLPLIEDFVTVLVTDPRAGLLLKASLRDPTIGKARMRNNLRRLLEYLGSDLKFEVEGRKQIHKKLVGFCKSYASNIASQAIETISKDDVVRAPDLSDRGSDIESASGSDHGSASLEIDQSAPHPDEPYTQLSEISEELAEFLTCSEAWQKFCHDLGNFVNNPLDSKLVALLRKHRSQHGQQPEESKFGRASHRLNHLIANLQFARPTAIRIAHGQSRSFLNSIKGWVESSWGEPWDWWPLQPYARELHIGEVRIRWTCCCGRERSAEVSKDFANDLSVIIDQYNSLESRKSGTRKHANEPSKTTKSQSSVEQLRSPHGPNLSSQHSPVRVPEQSSRLSSRPNPATAVADDMLANEQLDRRLHIFLIVKNGDRCSFSQKVVHINNDGSFSIADEEFFQWLRKEYLRLRHTWRRWLSIWRYKRCDFWQCERFKLRKFSTLREGFPTPEDIEYEFDPKPIEPRPPIGDEEFEDRFYSHEPQDANHFPKLCSLVARCLPEGSNIQQNILPLTLEKTPYYPPQYSVIKRLPKRTSAIEETKSGPRDTFYGLYALEAVALRCIMAWVVGLFIIPPTIFLFLWVFEFKHYDQLGAAINPLGLSISFVGIFFSILWNIRPATRNGT